MFLSNIKSIKIWKYLTIIVGLKVIVLIKLKLNIELK
jgi:hypothetical protein